MKKTILLILSLLMITPSWALDDDKKEEKKEEKNISQNNRNPRQPVSEAADCKIEEMKSVFKANPTKILSSKCEQLYAISLLNNQTETGFSVTDVKPTLDGKITCVKNGGYTVDFDDCKRVKNLYDTVTLAEQAMMAQQKIEVNEKNIQQNKEIAAAAAQGDTQYAAVEAVKKRNELNHKLYQNQATLYQTAVGLFGTGVAAWQGGNSLKKVCKDTKALKRVKDHLEKELSIEECQNLGELGKTAGVVFNNKDARLQFMGETAILFKKAAEAMKRAKDAAYVAERLNDLPGFQDDPTVALNFCFNNPNHPECKKNNGQNIQAGTFSGNTIDFGAASGNNQAFDFDAGGPIGSADDSTAVTGDTERVADISSPFEDQAKEASGILDPAAAASVTPGSQSPASGGGSGGGGGGGGSASLGDDLAGAKAEDSSDPEIKTNKVSGKFKGGGAGFQGIGKSGGKDENPFASLFDSKGESGGIEEDRSIASDMGGEGSGLFQKISKKYGQIHKDKRIESQNLE